MFPEIVPRYEKELQAWKGKTPGQHIVFADILAPYLIELIDSPRSEKRVRSAFEFLESLAEHDDPKIREVIALSVIDPLRNSCSKEKWVTFLGPTMSEILRDLEYS